MRTFIFRLEIREGCDEEWERLVEMPLTVAAEQIRKYIGDCLADYGWDFDVDVIGAKQDT